MKHFLRNMNSTIRVVSVLVVAEAAMARGNYAGYHYTIFTDLMSTPCFSP